MRTVLRGMTFLAVLNFCAFWYGTLILGGSAPNGKRESGRFFLGEHGKYVEVTEQVYKYSEVHATSVYLTHALGAIALLGLLALKDPFVTNHNKRRDALFFGAAVGSMVVGLAIRRPLHSLWLFPVIFVVYLSLDLRDASRAER